MFTRHYGILHRSSSFTPEQYQQLLQQSGGTRRRTYIGSSFLPTTEHYQPLLQQSESSSISPHQYIGFVTPFHEPITVPSAMDDPLPSYFSKQILQPINVPTGKLIEIDDQLSSPTPAPSLLDEPIPSEFHTSILQPITVPTAKLIDIELNFFENPLHCAEATLPILIDEAITDDPTPLLIPHHKAQKFANITAHPPDKGFDVNIICDEHLKTPHIEKETPASSNQRSTIRTYIFIFITLLVTLYRKILRCNSSESVDISTSLCKVRAKIKFLHTPYPLKFFKNPHTVSIVLTWSLLPPDKHPCQYIR